MVADMLAVLFGSMLAVLTWAGIGEPLREERYLKLTVLSLPAWVIVLGGQRLYSSHVVARKLEELRRLVRAVTMMLVALVAAAFMFRVVVPRGIVTLEWGCLILALSGERMLIRAWFIRERKAGRMLRPVVIVGSNLEALDICQMLGDTPGLGYEVRGWVGDESHEHGIDHLHKNLGTVRETVEAVRSTGSSGVIIAATAMDVGTSNRLIRELTDEGVHVELSSTLCDVGAHRLTVRPLGRFPMLYIEPVMRKGWRMAAKRCFDVFSATLGLIVSAPVMAACAVAIKLEDGGPVLFRQSRVGRDGTPFQVLKLRSMNVGAESRLSELQELNEADGPLFKIRDDPRITKVGRLIRKFSIDELPQLWNVMRNDMSLVGPRPALPNEVQFWGETFHARTRVKPGITGLWQVHGRSAANSGEYERLDLYYVDNWSLTTDIAIVIKTIPTVLLRRGAY